MMKKYHFMFLCFAAAFTVAGMTGCGPSGSLPASVEGIVTINGAPAPKGLEIIFQPVGPGTTCYGYTDAEGRYSLSLNPSKKGAQPGENKVTVQPMLVTEEKAATDDRGSGAGSDEVVPTSLRDIKIAKAFRDPGTHQVTVKDGPNTIDLEIAAE